MMDELASCLTNICTLVTHLYLVDSDFCKQQTVIPSHVFLL